MSSEKVSWLGRLLKKSVISKLRDTNRAPNVMWRKEKPQYAHLYSQEMNCSATLLFLSLPGNRRQSVPVNVGDSSRVRGGFKGWKFQTQGAKFLLGSNWRQFYWDQHQPKGVARGVKQWLNSVRVLWPAALLLLPIPAGKPELAGANILLNSTFC